MFEVRAAERYRTFELWEGDITDLPFPVDVLVISAFPGDYLPTPGSVVGALKRSGVDVRELARSPAYDFRPTPLSCWVSSPLDAPHIPDESCPRFRRLVCMEFRDRGVARISAVLFSVLALLEQLSTEGEHIRTVAVPALGAGDQGLDLREVVDRLAEASRDYLERARWLDRLVFVAYTPTAAEAFQSALETKLGRIRVSLDEQRVRAARGDVLAAARTLLDDATVPAHARPVLHDLARLLAWERAGSFELGVAGRRLAELVVQERLGAQKEADLLRGIEALAHHHVADWIRSYLHTLRVFGNNAAHEKHGTVRTPRHIDAHDLEVWCHCVRRVLEFWGSTQGG